MKKLLAIAVAAALVAPAAAMADTTLYGKLHASVGAVKGTTATAGANPVFTTASRSAVESHQSRIGVKGATALDNGMEATYGLEYNVELDGDNAANNLSARNQFVGLKGGFGEVRVGRHDTPAKLATAGLDVFADTYADMSTVVASDGHRVNNAVAYINKFGPVGFAAAHSTGIAGQDDATGFNQGNANTFMVNYATGPWYAALGHTNIQNNDALNGANAAKSKLTNLGLGYKAEAGHNVGLVYETNKETGTNAAATSLNNSQKAIYVGGGYKMGNVTLKAAVGQRKVGGSATANDNGKEKMHAFGVDYSLGKKTSVYLLATDNKNMQATVDGGRNSNAVAANGTVRNKATAIGLVTEF